jgi:putative transposase
MKLEKVKEDGFINYFTSILQEKERLVQIIAYCIMPTHLHLILKQLKENGISTFIGNVLNSYSRYFNTKYRRKGPLWEGKFKNVLVKTDEQLLHLTRYIHLNPSTAFLVDRPEEWLASSYQEYLLKVNNIERICKFEDVLEIEPSSYRKFIEDRISYQRELAVIKEMLLE